MARVFASYRMLDGWQRRCDTRFYFGEQPISIQPNTGRCIGALYLQNPGTAQALAPKKPAASGSEHDWGPLCYQAENLLPQVERVVEQALKVAKRKRRGNAAVETQTKNCYVQILNLSYLRKPSDPHGEAIKVWREVVKSGKDQDDIPRSSNSGGLEFIVFGWGNRLGVKSRDPERVDYVLAKCAYAKTALIWPLSSDIDRGVRLRPVEYGTGESIMTIDRLRTKHKKENPMYPVPRGKRDRTDKYASSVGDAIGTVLANLP